MKSVGGDDRGAPLQRELERYRQGVGERLPRVRETIEESAGRVNRSASEVTLVAVTKGHPAEAVEAVLEHGLKDLGENRVGGLEERVHQFGRNACRWHMVGRLQRRKAPRALAVADLIHSVGSVRLAERLDRVAPADRTGPVPVLLQVNASGEEAKAGFSADTFMEGLERILELTSLEVRGLMTMAPLTDDEEQLRRCFRRTRELHEAARARTNYRGTELSMGMSNDYGIAVEEGSTMVRLGTALLGERPE